MKAFLARSSSSAVTRSRADRQDAVGAGLHLVEIDVRGRHTKMPMLPLSSPVPEYHPPALEAIFLLRPRFW
jgi:hypothetical protein